MGCNVSFKNIKKYRKLKRYSQVELANEVGTSATTISRLENDREKQPRLDVIARIGHILEVCPMSLIDCRCMKEGEICELLFNAREERANNKRGRKHEK